MAKDVTETGADEFDVAAPASTSASNTESIPARVSVNPAAAPVVLPVILPDEDDEPPKLEALPEPSSFKDAIDLVQRCQREYEYAPEANRTERLRRRSLGLRLEEAKRLAFKLQQGPSFAGPAMPHPQNPPVERVQAMREKIIADTRK